MSVPQVLRGQRVLLPDGVRPASLHIQDGVILAVAGYADVPGNWPVQECGDLVLMPGVVDAHVHINEPGRTHWEGFETATRAAAAGGVTTLVDMPLNSIPPTTTLAALAAKRASAHGHVWVDVAFWGGAVPGNLADLAPMVEAGICGFKCFLVPSGVDEFENLLPADVPVWMKEIARLDSILLVHAELPGPIEAALATLSNADPRRYQTFLASRPKAAENQAVALVAAASEETGCHCHIVHLSSADAVETVSRARRVAPFSAETCPHYLVLAADEIPDGATAFKCCPPVRDDGNRAELWDGLKGGVLSQVVSDHSPSPPDLKATETGDFMMAWGGISSVQLSLSNTWTEARRRGASLTDVATWMCQAPATLAGLTSKGALVPGRDADVILFDPEASFEVTASGLQHCHPLCPYLGRTLQGVVRTTWLGGRVVFSDGHFATSPTGRLLRR